MHEHLTGFFLHLFFIEIIIFNFYTIEYYVLSFLSEKFWYFTAWSLLFEKVFFIAYYLFCLFSWQNWLQKDHSSILSKISLTEIGFKKDKLTKVRALVCLNHGHLIVRYVVRKNRQWYQSNSFIPSTPTPQFIQN